MAVGAHIDNQCTSDPARERRKKVNNYDNYSFELYGELNVMTLLSLSVPVFKIVVEFNVTLLYLLEPLLSIKIIHFLV